MFIAKTLLHRMWVAILFLLLLSPLNAQQYGWKVIARPTNYRLYTVEFVDTLHGWCAGRDTIYRTTDGGFTWKGSPGPFNPNRISDISFSDRQHGWVVGSDGLIWRSTNGGVLWIDQIFKFNRRYESTAAQSMAHNTTVGTKFFFTDTAIVMQTTNAGTTWKERTLADSIAAINKITFIDSLHGWALGALRNAASVLLRTGDGGKTWKVLKNPRTFTAISFIDSLRGWARGGGVHTTFDGGATWKLLGFTLPSDFYAKTLSFVDSLKGWAFGSQFFQGTDTEAIYRTLDGGKSWYQESIGLTGDFGGLEDALMLTQRNGWAVSYNGMVLSYQLLTSVSEKLDQAPKAFALEQNYPNPFNPTTTIQYSILKRSPVILRVFDALGRVINTLVDETQESGTYRVAFDGSSLASGTYFYKLTAGEFTATQVMNLLK